MSGVRFGTIALVWIGIHHLNNLAAWKARVDARPGAVKMPKEEAEIMAIHKAQVET